MTWEYLNGMTERRKSCHRCGNLRKDFWECKQCPQVYCFPCVDKMQEEYSEIGFVHGCPMCKGLCCCQSKGNNCHRKVHCYKKCPTAKLMARSTRIGSNHRDTRSEKGSIKSTFPQANKEPAPDTPWKSLIHYVENQYPPIYNPSHYENISIRKKRRQGPLLAENVSEKLNPLPQDRWKSEDTSSSNCNLILDQMVNKLNSILSNNTSILPLKFYHDSPTISVVKLPLLKHFVHSREHPLFPFPFRTLTNCERSREETFEMNDFDPSISLMLPELLSSQNHGMFVESPPFVDTNSTPSRQENACHNIKSTTCTDRELAMLLQRPPLLSHSFQHEENTFYPLRTNRNDALARASQQSFSMPHMHHTISWESLLTPSPNFQQNQLQSAMSDGKREEYNDGAKMPQQIMAQTSAMTHLLQAFMEAENESAGGTQQQCQFRQFDDDHQQNYAAYPMTVTSIPSTSFQSPILKQSQSKNIEQRPFMLFPSCDN